MVLEQSPTVRKLRLGIELRRLRLRAGRSMPEAADHVARTDSSISRMETGQVAVSERVLDKLCELYDARSEEREALRILAAEARQRGWWHAYGDSLLPGFDVHLGLEAEAGTHWIYEPEVVPGLLQTEGYMRELIWAEPRPLPDKVTNDLLAVRRRRQERLTGQDAPALWVVLHEGVLRHDVGGTATMRAQLEHLLSMSRQSNVTLQVLPFSAGAHPAMRTGGFTVLSIPIGGDVTYDVVYLEHRTGGLHLDRPADVGGQLAVHDRLRAKALSREDSRTLVERLARGTAPGEGADRRPGGTGA
ncbi:helix-turn-helix domain-containing protein [Actinomadura sp. HBU206391]|uniref:helix-turn-helix domain-containing protein n=1 Tax=Actinomadura sp. HBU206391 TaxID=2731692 RepID=UPI00165062F7|nr:helix-turn-helix transcriptional regulator [Actinomadura sp. HBU206391]MBC6458455.1 helix-turn-helix domain-containing protein [Actinomadura sp. HBU206391]